MLIQTLCSRLEQNFDEFVGELGPYLNHSLKDKRTLKQAASTISEICHFVESSQIKEGFTEYIPVLFNHLQGE